MTNRTTLDQLTGMDARQVSSLPIIHIEMLLEELAAMQTKAKGYADKIHAGMDEAFAERARDARRTEGKDTGTVRLSVDDVEVVADLPKTVEWDQTKLASALQIVAAWEGSKPEEYVSSKLSVPEGRFNAWPSPIRKIFEAARTVKAGKPTYKISRKDAA